MKQSRGLWAAILLLACVSCGRGQTVPGATLGIPTIINLPKLTNQIHLPVQGVRQADNEVWVNYQDNTKSQLSAAASTQDWNGMVHLAPGNNTLVIYGVVPLGRSAYSNGYVVVCDPYPPNAPTVYAPQGVFVGTGGTTTITISGTKDGDANVEVNGNVVAAADGSTTWTATVTVNAGNNTYTVTSVDAATNVSPAAVVTVYGSSLQTPVLAFPNVNPSNDPSFNPATAPYLTNQDHQLFYGTKQADTEIWVVINGGTPQDLGFMNSTSWDHNFTLPADGNYSIGYYVTQTGTQGQSGVAPVLVELNTSPPQAPIISSPSFPVPDTGDASLPIVGSLPSADSYFCVSATSDGPCIATSSTLGGNFNVLIPLIDGADGSGNGHNTGTNPLYISARDKYGNISTEIVQSVYRISPPQVGSVTPAANAVVSGNSLGVSLIATPFANDTGHAASLIASVEICLDTVCTGATAGSGGTYTASMDMTGFANGSTHTLTITVSDSLSVPLQTIITEQLVYSDGSPIWVSLNDAPQMIAQSPASALDAAGNLHVVWSDFCGQSVSCTVSGTASAQPPDIFYSRRGTDGSWSPVTMISALLPGDGVSQTPAVAVDHNQNVHVVWSDDGTVGGKQSGLGIVHLVLDHTKNWQASAPDAVGSHVTGVDDVNPSLTADSSGAVHLAFTRKTSSSRYDIEYARYNSGAWGSLVQATTASNTGQADLSTISANPSGAAHIAWQECRTDTSNVNHCTTQVQHNIYMQEIVPSGTVSWSTAVQVSDAPSLFNGDGLQPTIVTDSNAIDWVAWSDAATLGSHSAPYNIWLQTYSAGGVKQNSSYQIVSSDPNTVGEAASQPHLTLGPGANGQPAIGVVWTQQIASQKPDIASRFGQVSYGPSSLTDADTVYPQPTPGTSQSADVTINSSGDLFVVWADDSTFGSANTSGVEQIFWQVESP